MKPNAANPLTWLHGTVPRNDSGAGLLRPPRGRLGGGGRLPACEAARPAGCGQVEATGPACARVGREYWLAGAAEKIVTANVRWLAGRPGWLHAAGQAAGPRLLDAVVLDGRDGAAGLHAHAAARPADGLAQARHGTGKVRHVDDLRGRRPAQPGGALERLASG